MKKMSRLHAVSHALEAMLPAEEVGLFFDDGRPSFGARIPDRGYDNGCETVHEDTFVQLVNEFGIGCALEILREAEGLLAWHLKESRISEEQIAAAVAAEGR